MGRPSADSLGQQLTEALTSPGGEITSPTLIKLFRRANKLTTSERALRDELFLVAWDLCGHNFMELKRRTGMPPNTAKRILKMWKTREAKVPQLANARLETEVKLEEIRYQGRKELIEQFWHGARLALERAVSTIAKANHKDAARTAAIFTDKGLLLSGQPTSRVSRVDERTMSDEELQKRAAKLDKEVARLRLVDKKGA
jgi:hypothetical protein